MGSILRICCVSTAFCCFDCCLKQFKTCCGGLFGRERIAKFLCILLDVLVVIPGIVIFFFLQQWSDFLNKFVEWIKCPKESGGGLNCFGISAVYRLSMSLLAVYFIIMIVMICRNRLSKVVNQGLFIIKFLLVVGGFIGFLFIPNSVFMSYGYACKIMGLVFLVLQSIILIDLFYMWGISWVTKYSQGKSSYGFLLIFFSLIMYTGAIVMNVFSYILFKNNYWNTIITSILILLIPITQFFNFNIQNSLLTTSAICCYISYLNFMSLFSNPQCHGCLTKSVMGAEISVSSLLFFITMFGSIMGGSGVIKTAPETSLNQALGLVVNQEQNYQNDDYQVGNQRRQQVDIQPLLNQQQNKIQDSYNGWQWVRWYLYMCIGSMYIGVLVTNWGSPQQSDRINIYNSNDYGYWSRIGLSWITTLLYLWTLVAPKIFPNRNFVIE